MELLIEFFCEEIPARMQAQAKQDFKTLWTQELQNIDLTVEVSPRRLVMYSDNVAATSTPIIIERRGPKVGAPESAMQGFLKATNLDLSQLIQQNGYWIARIEQAGQPLSELLPIMIDKVIKAMPWPTSMRWPGAEHPWVRPIRNIACVYGGSPVVFEVKAAGITTNNLTFGHRFLSPKPITISSIAQYQDALQQAKVMLNNKQHNILEQLQQLCALKGLQYKEDESLLNEVAGLVEYPFVGLGSIEEKFMKLPSEVLSTSMRIHQKYFTILNTDLSPAPFFAFVANVPINQGEMVKNYEKVLRARLSDALFFYEQDVKIPLRDKIDSLKHIVFHQTLGSVYDKVQRLVLCAQDENVKEAALLCKVDLTTLMVGEFPELQGVMGEIYSLAQGELPAIAKAIAEHYKSVSTECPTSWQLSLLDKIDTLVGFIGINVKPSGSKDPYGLRRAALGIIRLMLSLNKPCDLQVWIKRSVDSYQQQGIILQPNTFQEVINFITERLANFLRNEMPADHVYAVLDQPLHDIWQTVEKARALKDLLHTPAGVTLLAAYRRVVGILKQAYTHKADPGLFADHLEQQLFNALDEVNLKIKLHLEKFDFIQAMRELAILKPIIDQFFDQVKVMDENPQIKHNRLCLLQQLQTTMHSFANFAKLEG